MFELQEYHCEIINFFLKIVLWSYSKGEISVLDYLDLLKWKVMHEVGVAL